MFITLGGELMRAMDKVFFTSAVIRAAGCSSETFRSWRNRNGLFPETQGAEGWNRFSVVDILAVSIVSTLTDAGLTAQVAVNVAKEAVPVLSKALGNEHLCDDDDPDLEQVMFSVVDRLVRRDLVLVIELRGFETARIKVSLLPKDSRAALLLSKSTATMVVSIAHLMVTIGTLWVRGADVEIRPGIRKKIAGKAAFSTAERKK